MLGPGGVTSIDIHGYTLRCVYFHRQTIADKITSMQNAHCYICNAIIPDIDGPTSDHTYIPQSPGCWKLYTEVLAREYGEWNYPPIHRLTVDCYAAQHPTKTSDPKSAQSVQVHLLGLFLALEKKVEPRQITKLIADVIVKNKNTFTWLEPPKNLGVITISDVWNAKTLNEHEILVNDWANSIWQAWKRDHPSIKKLLD